MDSRRLLVFREVARAGSLAGAARALGWTQPAVSQQVRRLEAEAGTPLVVREGRGVVLTEAGRRLLRHAEAIADRLAAAEQDMAALTGLATGVVRVAAFPTAAAVLVPPALAALRERAPALEVHFAELEPPEAEAAVREGATDLAVVFRHEDDDDDEVPGDLLREPLARHPVQAVVPDGSPVPAALADLRDEPWIAGCVRCRRHLLRCARRAGFVPDVRFATDDHVVVQRLVARGLGVALLPAWAFAVGAQPGVTAVELADVDGRVVETLVRPDARRVPAVAAALEALRAAG
ncbi:ModE molybdate transport repressor domain-containing protein [Geodermatophilus saharensis]|uniref:ModE molybdate transport repressor domain-containing protein n=1 Tax=Geodermatophilus saharensis TaxID=1137994 RepID=A0A239D6K8_9ACTN|nr:LysR substrate-binding domain-containing protein [Geodermatophilus saharensis]SNS28136.1 ModE molybdate transport repressor domain-containing protein [Geodermatophilus saharensis]